MGGGICPPLERTITHVPYFRDQTPHSISSRPRIIAAPLEGMNEINAALVLVAAASIRSVGD